MNNSNYESSIMFSILKHKYNEIIKLNNPSLLKQSLLNNQIKRFNNLISNNDINFIRIDNYKKTTIS